MPFFAELQGCAGGFSQWLVGKIPSLPRRVFPRITLKVKEVNYKMVQKETAKEIALKVVGFSDKITKELRACKTKEDVLNCTLRNSPPISRSQIDEIMKGA